MSLSQKFKQALQFMKLKGIGNWTLGYLAEPHNIMGAINMFFKFYTAVWVGLYSETFTQN